MNASALKLDNYSDFVASKMVLHEPMGIEPGGLPDGLFDFQESIVKWAVRRGRAAIWADTGLGKTRMQLAWADQVSHHTGKPVLLLAPLCVAQQTVRESDLIGIMARYCRRNSQIQSDDHIVVTNYEMMDRFNIDDFAGIVLDESSILKAMDGKTRKSITDGFRNTPFRLSCTATPSPNDYMELGNQAEFLGIMSATEMMATYFTHDGGDTSKWRLKGHGKTKFWEWLASWAVCIRNPDDLGFDGSRFILPPLNIHEHIVDVSFIPDGELFPSIAQTLSERRCAKRISIDARVKLASDLVNRSDEPWIVWCHLNDESTALAKLIPDSIEVTGSMSNDEKESRIMAFLNGEKRVIVSKPSIMGFGLNFQFSRNQVFSGVDDSFERFYQAVRRQWRFGQTKEVNIHIITSEGEIAVKKNIERKQSQMIEMQQQMVDHMRDFTRREVLGTARMVDAYHRDVAKGDGWTLYLGDCVDVYREIPDNSVDYTVFSPPFASLYTYSNSPRDMGNVRSYSEFYKHFHFLVSELLRTTKPGRLLSFHCMNLQMSKQNFGFIGLHDFRGELIRMFQDAGWIYHSEVCIWKDPVIAMQRTKALGLLYKQLKKDSCMSRQGIPDYLVTMRKPGENPEPVTKDPEEFPVSLWQRYASPVWFDINPSRTLQFQTARESDDERHICPLQLDVIERAIELWSNPGDLVASPFAGIGSEGHVALQMGRRFIGAELKRSYWELACKNLRSAKRKQGDLLAGLDDGA